MTRTKPRWTAGAARVGAATLSGGAALASILSYTSSAGIAMPGAAAVAALRVHTVTIGPTIDTAEAIGDTIQLAAVVTDSSGTVLMGIVPAWTTGDPTVALVTQAGTVTAQGAGATAIVVRVGQVEARSRIVVRQVPASLEMGDTAVTVPENQRAALTAHVADARGNPIVGAEVSWAATDPVIALVEGSEVVGVSPGRSEVSASAGPLVRSLPVEVVPVPSSITVLGGEGQHGPAGRTLAAPVSAQIVCRTGRPMAGVPATFRSMSPNSAAEPAVDTSDARGMVHTSWRLGDTPGRQQLMVHVDGVGVVPALAAEADPVPSNTRIELLPAEPTGRAGDTLGQPIVVRVSDSLGNALSDVPVTWSALDGGAIGGITARTDSLGEGRATWTLGPRAGRQRARIQVGAARSIPPLIATATAFPGPALGPMIKSGDRQLGTVGTALKLPLVFRVVDKQGNPVAGVAIQVEALAGKVAESKIVSDSAGYAKVRWTLGRAGGLQRLEAFLDGDTVRTEVTALARPGKAAKLAFLSPPDVARSGKPLPKPLVVQVTDGYGNPLGGQTVVFTSTSGTVTPSRGLTDVEGRATVRWTPGPKSRKPELSGQVAGSEVQRTLTLSARP